MFAPLEDKIRDAVGRVEGLLVWFVFFVFFCLGWLSFHSMGLWNNRKRKREMG